MNQGDSWTFGYTSWGTFPRTSKLSTHQDLECDLWFRFTGTCLQIYETRIQSNVGGTVNNCFIVGTLYKSNKWKFSLIHFQYSNLRIPQLPWSLLWLGWVLLRQSTPYCPHQHWLPLCYHTHILSQYSQTCLTDAFIMKPCSPKLLKLL